MIRHIVLVRFKPETTTNEISTIFTELSALHKHVEGMLSFMGGKSESPEQIERGYLHGFTIDFTDWAALKRYADHPLHKAAGAKLVAAASGGIDGLLVVDLVGSS